MNAVVAVAVVAACVIQVVVMGRAVTPLVVALVLSYVIWAARDHWPVSRPVVVSYLAAMLVQSIHLVEEYATGFYAAFPPVVGADPWPGATFLLFNLAWLAVFVVGAVGVGKAERWAFVIALFLAIGGGIGNGLGHLALAAQRRGYFPGAYTAVLVLAAGSVLLWNLMRAREVA